MNKKAQEKTNPLPPEIERIQRKLTKDVLERDRLEKEYKTNPDEEKQREIERLSREIETNQRLSGEFAFSDAFEEMDKAGEKMIELVKNFDDKVFIIPEQDELIASFIRALIDSRNDFYDFKRHFFLPADAQKIVDLYEEKITRLKQLVKEKRQSAARQYPAHAAHLKEPKVVMSDEYNKWLKILLEMVEKRDEAKKMYKYAAPSKRKQMAADLAKMDKLLDQGEAQLAEIYERHQKRHQYLQGLRTIFNEASRSELNSMREQLKENPGKYPEMEKLLADEFPEEE